MSVRLLCWVRVAVLREAPASEKPAPKLNHNQQTILVALTVAGGHPYVNGDVVLVRRAGVGLFSLGSVLGATGTAFNLSSLSLGIPLHAILAGDEVFLVEAYWLGMVWRDFEPRDERGWWAREVGYTFRGGGALTYARTTATVGS